MKLPSQKRILREDLKGAPDWVNGIIGPVNSFMETVYQAMNKNITFKDNIASFIREFRVTTDATYPTIPAVTTFNNELKTKSIGLSTIYAVDSSYNPAPGPVYCAWVEDNGIITISNITGLEPSKTYTIRVMVI